MQRIDNATASTSLPTPAAPGTPGYFYTPSPQVGGEATIVDQDWMNSVQEELCNVIGAARPAITLDKTNRTQLLQALNQLFLPRILVTAPLTLYVNPTTGNDANNAATPATAVKTIQQAINIMFWWYNWNNNGCTIQLADGTYPYAVTGGASAQFYGQPLGMPRNGITLLGNSSNPDNVQITATNGTAINIVGCAININGVSVTGTGNTWNLGMIQGMGIAVQSAGWVTVSNFRAKNCGMFPMRADNGSVIALQGSNNKITGVGQYGIYAGEAGLIWAAGTTLDVTSFASTYGTFVCDQGRMELETMTFLGSASCTGPRYGATNCGCILTAGGGASYLPGSTAGSITAGGQYV